MEQERERIRIQEGRCPFCHEEIPRGEEPIACPACHAAHHGECFEEAGGSCSACGEAHPRYARPAQRARQLPAPEVEELRTRMAARAATWLVMVLAVPISLMVVAGDYGNDDARVYGAAVAIAAAFGCMTQLILPPVLRTLRRFWGFFLAAFGVGLVAAPGISQHIASRHADPSYAWGAILLLLGLVLVWVGGSRPSKEREEPPEKGA